ncbi:hypothetical protein R80B4_02321 [Fibrobacteres bacterium R8-0-B4]
MAPPSPTFNTSVTATLPVAASAVAANVAFSISPLLGLVISIVS